MSDQLLYTVSEVAAMLGVGRTTLYEEMNRGHLAYVKIGRSRRISSEQVRRYVTSLGG